MANRPANAGSGSIGTGRAPAPHRAARPLTRPGWLPYLIVAAGVAAGLYVAWQGSRHAAAGVAVVGCSLLAAALARLMLPDRYAGLLASRRKASDVLAFAVLGTAILAVVLSLP